MIVYCWIKNLKFNVNSIYIFGFLNFCIVPFFLMSQVFKVRISECPSFWVKYYGDPIIESNVILIANKGLKKECNVYKLIAFSLRKNVSVTYSNCIIQILVYRNTSFISCREKVIL
jgi:hypothetical protein